MSQFSGRPISEGYVSSYPNHPSYRPRSIDFVELTPRSGIDPDWVGKYLATLPKESPQEETDPIALDLGRLAIPGLVDELADLRQQLGSGGEQ